MVHFDAHVDTWPDSFGQPLGPASVFYRAIVEGLVDQRRMIQIGIRSPVERAVYESLQGRSAKDLRDLLEQDNFMQWWDIKMRYAKNGAVTRSRVDLWRGQANKALSLLYQ